jgi:hypothetical protein
VAAVPDGHPDRAEYLYSLGSALQARYRHTGEQDVLAEARAALARAAQSTTGTISTRIAAGRQQARADMLAGDSQAALAAMETAVQLLPLLASRIMRREDREYHLAEAAGIGSKAQLQLCLLIDQNEP